MNAFASGSMLLSVTAAAKSCVTLHGSIPNLNMHACRECSPLLMVRSDRSNYFITLCSTRKKRRNSYNDYEVKIFHSIVAANIRGGYY